MKNFITYLLAACLLCIPTSYANNLYQVSTGNAIMEGLYQGAVDFKTLREHGDFGLGSVEHMDGELIAIGGGFYRIDPQGKMHSIPDSQTTPYALVTHFQPRQTFRIKHAGSFADLIQQLNQHIPNRHIPYAIHLRGRFTQLALRAVHRQQPPYPPFPQVAKGQSIFNLSNKLGDGVGFFTPPYLGKVNVPGYHIHFITQDRATGGHILKGQFDELTVELMPMNELTIVFPKTAAFRQAKQLDTDFRPMMQANFGAGVQKQ